MVYGYSQTIERTLLQACKRDKKVFTVLGVDSGENEFKDMIKTLSHAGIKCTVTLIQCVNCFISKVTRFYWQACAVLSSGEVIGKTGSALISYIVCQYHVPVVVVSESYKFTDMPTS